MGWDSIRNDGRSRLMDDILKSDGIRFGMAKIAIKWVELKWKDGYYWNKIGIAWARIEKD